MVVEGGWEINQRIYSTCNHADKWYQLRARLELNRYREPMLTFLYILSLEYNIAERLEYDEVNILLL